MDLDQSTTSRCRIGIASAGMALLGTQLGGLLPAGAQTAPAAESLAVHEETTTDHPEEDYVEVQDLAPGGAVLGQASYSVDGSRVTVGPDGSLSPVPIARSGSGSGGGSSANGCRKVTVKNVGKSILGKTVYSYNTWTEWCWDRSAHTISSLKTGQNFTQVASTMYYRGLVLREERAYAWRSGYNKSGHWHERQAHWENCVAKYGCISSDYPRNVLRAHSDGSYTWATHD